MFLIKLKTNEGHTIKVIVKYKVPSTKIKFKFLYKYYKEIVGAIN